MYVCVSVCVYGCIYVCMLFTDSLKFEIERVFNIKKDKVGQLNNK